MRGVAILARIRWLWVVLLSASSQAAPLVLEGDLPDGGPDMFDSPIGNPTTMVFATALDAAAIVDGIRKGHTVVKLQGPGDPMVDLRVGDGMVGDTVIAQAPPLKVTVTGGVGSKLVVFKDGAEFTSAEVTTDPFELADVVNGGGRFRAEVQLEGQPRTVTANLWVESPVAPPPPGCGCDGGTGLLLFAALGLLRRPQRAT